MGKILFIFWCIFLGIGSVLKAEILQLDQESLVTKLIENESYCVRSIQEDKIYIAPDKLIIVNEGLFLDLNGTDFCRLSLLQANEQGCFIEMPSIIQNALLPVCKKARESKGRCPNCDLPTDKEGRCINLICAFCGYKVL